MLSSGDVYCTVGLWWYMVLWHDHGRYSTVCNLWLTSVGDFVMGFLWAVETAMHCCSSRLCFARRFWNHTCREKNKDWRCIFYNIRVLTMVKTNLTQQAPLGSSERRTGASMEKFIRLHHFLCKHSMGLSLRNIFDPLLRYNITQ